MFGRITKKQIAALDEDVRNLYRRTTKLNEYESRMLTILEAVSNRVTILENRLNSDPADDGPEVEILRRNIFSPSMQECELYSEILKRVSYGRAAIVSR